MCLVFLRISARCNLEFHKLAITKMFFRVFFKQLTAFEKLAFRNFCGRKVLLSMDQLPHIPRYFTSKMHHQQGQRLKCEDNNISIRVVTGGIKGCGNCVIINCSRTSFLFNCCEEFQRTGLIKGIKMKKIGNVFITHSHWNNIGGLIALYVEQNDKNIPELNLHGPPGVEQILRVGEEFNPIMKRDLKLNVMNIEDEPFKEDVITVHQIPIYSQLAAAQDTEQTGEPDPERLKVGDKKQDMSVAYVCKFHPEPRRIDVNKVAALDIPLQTSSAVLRTLCQGETVTLEDGRVICPDDILKKAVIWRPIIVIDCPTEGFLESLLKNQEFHQYQNGGNPENTAELIIHFTPMQIFRDPRYQEWIQRFSPDTKNLYFDEEESISCAFPVVYAHQALLNKLDDDVFPLLANHRHFMELKLPTDPEFNENFVKATTDLVYTYRPAEKKGFKIMNDSKNTTNGEVWISSEAEKVLKEVKKKTATFKKGITEKKEFPEIIFLGTGASRPNLRRNVSSILVHLSSDESILLDCGEGTYAQLVRFYGDKVVDVMAKLKAIYISHLHIDHHMGICTVLLQRRNLLQRLGLEVEPVMVIAGRFMSPWIQTIGEDFIEDINSLFELFSTNDFMPDKYWVSNRQRVRKQLVQRHVTNTLGLTEFRTTLVGHCRGATGLLLRHKKNWSLVYSGDAEYSRNLVALGKDCDVLIHEATFSEEEKDLAVLHKHCTTSQAIQVGQEMNAKFTLLTHFSQRYGRVPEFNDSFNDKVGVAHDFMRVRLTDLPLLPMFNHPLELLFSSERN